MTPIAELFATAFQQHQAGLLPQAAELYQQILQQQPNHAGALNLMGVIVCQSGNVQEGLTLYQRAVAAQPDLMEAHFNLAIALEMVGQPEEAIAHYRTALSLQPNHAELHNNLGSLLVNHGKVEAGMGHFRQALAIKPDYAHAHINLGALLAGLGRVEAAIAHLQQALRLQPDAVVAHHQLGHILNSQGRLDEAAFHLQQALAIQPTAELHFSLGKTLEEQGRTEAAIVHFQAALKLRPDFAEAFWQEQLALPVLYDTPEQILSHRQRFCQGLNHLIAQLNLNTSAGRQFALRGIGSRTNFYLAYQGFDDRELQSQYGQLVHQVMAANFPQWVKQVAGGRWQVAGERREQRGQGKGFGKRASPLGMGEARNRRETNSSFKLQDTKSALSRSPKIRLGYLSAHLMAHSAAAWVRGWVRAHDRDQFEIYCYHLSGRVDAITQEFRDISDVFRHLPGGLESICAQVIADQLDILVLTDIGMDPQTTQIAGLRLAPVQCTAWGHPVTSGIPTIDYYLSSQLMEPENAQQHYTEKLVLLPNIGICYPKPPLPELQQPRSAFGLQTDAVVYLCFQSPYKYLPQYDRVFAQIAQQVPRSRFVFLRHSSAHTVERFQNRLKQAFAEFQLNSADYCVFLPKLDRESYWSLNLACDVFLDSFEWSGGNSTLEAVAYGLPVVTCPGKFMRGRHSSAILQLLSVTETIAQTVEDYIEIAVKLGLDPGWREEIRQKTFAHHAQLYDDKTCVQGLEAFYRQVLVA
jgi:predicted O-linked N-acetylglucosamine transferase (SPINDLY family)